MGFHEPAILEDEPQRMLGAHGPRLAKLGTLAAVVGLGAAVCIAAIADHGAERVLFAYLINFAYFVSIALGALLFVMVHFVTKTGTITTYRRIGEIIAATLPIMAVFVLPILLFIKPLYYGWVMPFVDPVGHADPLVAAKAWWLHPPLFFQLRVVVYLVTLGWLARWFLKTSTAQDQTADAGLTLKMQARATWGVPVFAVFTTLFAFDVIKTLDPHWFSTIFGVYYFAGGFMAFHALMGGSLIWLQRKGLVTQSVNAEHYHDIGKMMFAFVVFWAYIAFSQYMLIWYGNIPEETVWYIRRGATTDPAHVNGWTWVTLTLLVTHFFIPFAGLISRHVKRSPAKLWPWCVWLGAVHYLDMIWLIRPELKEHVAGHPTLAVNGWDAVAIAACLVGLGGVFLVALAKAAAGRSLVAHNDPRLPEGLAFENV